MTFGFLRTRVARRFLAVNLLTALLPVAVVMAVSFAYVRSELRVQAETRVQRLSKSVGMTTLTYLASLRLIATTLPGEVSSTPEFERIVRSDALTGIPPGITGLPPRPLSSAEAAQLAAGRSLLFLVPSGDERRIVLARSLPGTTPGVTPIVWTLVRREAVFDEAEEGVLGEDAQFCVFDAASVVRITCNGNLDDDAIRIAERRARAGGTERDAIGENGYFVSARDIYLKHEYASPEWRVVVMQPPREAVAAAASFRNTFLLLAAAVVILIFAVSHAQIRRTTEPLAQLQDGTRRLQAGDFSTPVVVKGDDEYAEVASSFNGMASALHRQIALMHSLDAVDQSALGTRDTGAVIDEALTCIVASLEADSITMAIVAPDDHTTLDAITTSRHGGVRLSRRLVLGARERDELLAHPRQLVLAADAAPRTYLYSLEAPTPVLILPLVNDQSLIGLIVARTNDVPSDAESWSEARRLADRVALALSNVQLLTRLDALSAGTVLAFARAIDANSPWTAGHSERVTRVAMEIGRELELSAAELDTLERGGLLHDIGKIAVPPAVLDKAGRLTDEEWAVMRRHPVVGCEILSPIPAFADALPIVRSHHERMDGTGYPDRLYGEEIPYLARVLAVADVFDALASDRPYRAGMTTVAACEIIRNGSGSHFDPRIVRAFMDAVNAGRIEAGTPATDSRTLAASVARARGAGVGRVARAV